jgi:antirestriction protein ArdC
VETDAWQLPASAREREAPLLHRIKTARTVQKNFEYRFTALFALAAELPAAILVRTLGIHRR